MTNQPTKLERVEAEIRRLVPRLNEPIKGCYYEFKSEYRVNAGFLFEVGDRLELVKMDVKYECFFLHPKIRDVLEIPRSFVKSSLEIIGHPIYLEAVLEATAYEDQTFWISHSKEGVSISIETGDSDYGAIYDTCILIYGKPLAEQSEKTVDFLFSILFPNE